MVIRVAVRLLTTMSRRSRVQGPVCGGVAQVGGAEAVVGQLRTGPLRPGPCCSPYGVTGNRSASSVTSAEAGAPYRLQEEANRKRSMPTCLATRARCSVPSKVHRVGRLGVKVAERVVGQRRQADHRVVAGQRAAVNVPHVGGGAAGRPRKQGRDRTLRTGRGRARRPHAPAARITGTRIAPMCPRSPATRTLISFPSAGYDRRAGLKPRGLDSPDTPGMPFLILSWAIAS